MHVDVQPAKSTAALLFLPKGPDGRMEAGENAGKDGDEEKESVDVERTGNLGVVETAKTEAMRGDDAILAAMFVAMFVA